MNFSKSTWIVVGAAVLLRLFVFGVVLFQNPEGFEVYDSRGYLQLAENITQYGAFSRSEDPTNLLKDASRTPVYPFFLACFSWMGVVGIILVQVLMSAATVLFTVRIAQLIIPKFKYYWLVGLPFALEWGSIYVSNTIMTESLFVLLLTSGVYYFLLYSAHPLFKYGLFASILIALSILCRPIALFIPILLGVYLGLKKLPLAYCISFTFMCYLFVSPWLIRNYTVFSSPFISSIGSINLLMYTSADIKAEIEGVDNNTAQKELLSQIQEEFTWTNTEADIAPFLSICKQRTWDLIKDNPLVFLKQRSIMFVSYFIKPMRNGIDLMFGVHKQWYDPVYTSKKSLSEKIMYALGNTSLFSIALVGYQVAFLLLFFGIGLFGLPMGFNNKPLLVLLLGIVFYFAITSSITEIHSRMRVPILPFYGILFALGMEHILELKNKRDLKS